MCKDDFVSTLVVRASAVHLSCIQICDVQATKFPARSFFEFSRRKNNNFSEFKLCFFHLGPPRIPLFGSYLFLLVLNHRHLHKAIDFLAKWYKSNIIGIYLGATPAIILNDTEKVKKALFHRDFDGKPDLLLGRLREPNMILRGMRYIRIIAKQKSLMLIEMAFDSGIFFTEGKLWHEQRRFALRYLRDFGFGRRFQALEIEIQEEMRSFMDLLKYGPKFEHEKVG